MKFKTDDLFYVKVNGLKGKIYLAAWDVYSVTWEGSQTIVAYDSVIVDDLWELVSSAPAIDKHRCKFDQPYTGFNLVHNYCKCGIKEIL